MICIIQAYPPVGDSLSKKAEDARAKSLRLLAEAQKLNEEKVPGNIFITCLCIIGLVNRNSCKLLYKLNLYCNILKITFKFIKL